MKKALFRIGIALSMTLFCAMNSYSATANNVTTDVYNWQGGTNNYVISLGTTPLKNFSVEFEANAIKDFYIGLYSDTYIREASPTVSIVSNSTQGAGSTKQVLSALVEMLYGCWEKNAYKGFFVEQKNKRALSTGYTKLPGAATNYLASSKTDFKKYRYTVALTGTIFAITLSCLNTKTNAFDEILAFNNTSFNAITTTDTSLPPIAGQKENLITALNKTSFKGFTQIGFVSTTADPYAIKNVAVTVAATAPDSAITKSQIAGYQAQSTAGLAPALAAPAPSLADRNMANALMVARSTPDLDNALPRTMNATNKEILKQTLAMPSITEPVIVNLLKLANTNERKTILTEQSALAKTISDLKATAQTPALLPFECLKSLSNEAAMYITEGLTDTQSATILNDKAGSADMPRIGYLMKKNNPRSNVDQIIVNNLSGLLLSSNQQTTESIFAVLNMPTEYLKNLLDSNPTLVNRVISGLTKTTESSFPKTHGFLSKAVNLLQPNLALYTELRDNYSDTGWPRVLDKIQNSELRAKIELLRQPKSIFNETFSAQEQEFINSIANQSASAEKLTVIINNLDDASMKKVLTVEFTPNNALIMDSLELLIKTKETSALAAATTKFLKGIIANGRAGILTTIGEKAANSLELLNKYLKPLKKIISTQPYNKDDAFRQTGNTVVFLDLP